MSNMASDMVVLDVVVWKGYTETADGITAINKHGAYLILMAILLKLESWSVKIAVSG